MNKKVRIADLLTIKRGKRYPAMEIDKYWSNKEDYLCLKIGDIKPFIKTTKYKLSLEGITVKKNFHKCFFKKNSFVMAVYGATLGKIGWLKKDVFGSDGTIIFISDNLILKKYLYYFFLKKRKKIFSLKTGTANPGINLNQIENLEINLPDQKTQEKIVEKLEFLFKNKQIIEEKIDKFEKIFKLYLFSSYQKLKKQNTNNKKLIKDLVTIKKGRHYPSPQQKKYWDHQNGFLWLKIGDIKSFTTTTKCKLSKLGIETIKNYQTFQFKKDSFVMAIDGNIGKLGWLKDCFYASTHLVNFDSKDLILKKYLYYYFLKNQKKICNLRVGTVIPSIKLKKIENLEINLPDQKTQERIVREFDLLAKQIENLKQFKSSYQHLIKLLIHKLIK